MNVKVWSTPNHFPRTFRGVDAVRSTGGERVHTSTSLPPAANPLRILVVNEATVECYLIDDTPEAPQD